VWGGRVREESKPRKRRSPRKEKYKEADVGTKTVDHRSTSSKTCMSTRIGNLANCCKRGEKRNLLHVQKPLPPQPREQGWPTASQRPRGTKESVGKVGGRHVRGGSRTRQSGSHQGNWSTNATGIGVVYFCKKGRHAV